MGEYRAAREPDRAALERIWLASFPYDTPADVAAFFDSGFSPEQAVVCTIEEQPVSMAFLLPTKVALSQNVVIPAGYIYAAATLPTFRGQGLFASLLKTAHRMAWEAGMRATLLRPAEPSLEAYYARLGYRSAFQADRFTVTRRQAELAAAAVGPAPQRLSFPSPFREAWLARHRVAHVMWDATVWRYAIYGAGGEYWEGPSWAALCEPSADRMLVRELLCDEALLPEVYRHICRQYRFSTCTIRRPAIETAGEHFGMIHPLDQKTERLLSDQPLYMGLALD